jgi:hypothetical protein
MGSFLLAIPPTFRSNLARGKLDTHNPLLRNQPSDACPAVFVKVQEAPPVGQEPPKNDTRMTYPFIISL